MTVQLIIDNITIPIEKVLFSDGGSNVKLIKPESLQEPFIYLSITVDPSTPVDNYVWEIFQILDAVNHTFGKDSISKKYLNLPYLPHGRADRVFEKGNGNPLKMFMDIMGGLFDEIFITDPHSMVNVRSSSITIRPQQECFMEACGAIVKSGDCLISPDKGALDKIYSTQRILRSRRNVFAHVIEANKKRDISTGRIIETTIPEEWDLSGKVCWIVDDISDGNGTFIPLAEKLKIKGASKVNLYVTHLIAAKGLGNLFGLVDKIYCYQVVGNYINSEDVRNFNNGIEPRRL